MAQRERRPGNLLDLTGAGSLKTIRIAVRSNRETSNIGTFCKTIPWTAFLP